MRTGDAMAPAPEDDLPSPRPPSPPRASTTSPITAATSRTSLSADQEDPPPPTTTSFPRPPRPTPAGARRLSRRSLLHDSSLTSTSPQSLFATAITAATSLAHTALRLYRTLTFPQRILLLCGLAVLFALGIVFLVYSHRIFAALGPLAEKWRDTPAGWVPIWLATFCTAFPPVIGYSTCVTVAGFVYGFPAGWPLAASATVAGSTVAFLTSRGIFAGYVQRLVGKDNRFVALGQVLRRDGIGVLVAIRLCPLPYSLSNGFLATVGSINVKGFALATAGATPKLLVHIFIGSRLAKLAKSGDKMSGGARALNYASMAVFGIIGLAVGLFIYRRTMARAAELAREAELEAGDALLDNAALGDDDLEQGVMGDDDRMIHPDELDAAALMDDDDISLWDTSGGNGYTDSWDDEEGVESAGSKAVGANGHGK